MLARLGFRLLFIGLLILECFLMLLLDLMPDMQLLSTMGFLKECTNMSMLFMILTMLTN